MSKVGKSFRRIFLTGLLVIIPLGLTFFILKFLFGLVDGILAPAIWGWINYFFPAFPAIPGFGIMAFVFLVFLVGLIATNVFGRRIIGWGENLIKRTPIVKGVYTASKQITEAVSLPGKASFKRVVFLEFLAPGSYSIGFVTGEFEDSLGTKLISIFMPTAPNPTSGYVIVTKAENVIVSPMSVEDGVKMVMSGGIVPPPKLLVPLDKRGGES